MRFKRVATVPVGYLDSPLKQVVSAGHGDGHQVVVEGVVNDYEWGMAEIMARNSSIFFTRGTDILVSLDMGQSTLLFRLLHDGGVEVYRSC